jgi:hypothetical protein
MNLLKKTLKQDSLRNKVLKLADDIKAFTKISQSSTISAGNQKLLNSKKKTKE